MFFFWIRTKDKKVFLERLLYTDSFLPKKAFGRKITYIVLGISAHFETSSRNCEAFNSVFTKADFK